MGSVLGIANEKNMLNRSSTEQHRFRNGSHRTWCTTLPSSNLQPTWQPTWKRCGQQSPEERNCQSPQVKKMMQHLYTPSSID